MKAFFKSKKGIALIVSLLVVTLIGVGVGCYFIFRKKLKLDWGKGAIAVNIVENAQYKPDMDKFIEANSETQGVATLKNNSKVQFMNSASSEENQAMTQEEFGEFIDKYATVENYAGAGKYQGYDIYEIKNEIKYVVEKVPAFNQWFRMPTMRERQGYVSIPYYESWAYYLEMDEENRLNITRVCWSTRSDYLDFENQKTIEDHADGTSFVQYEIMKTKYYENEEGKEVVETFLYSVGIDNVKNTGHCNENTKDYYPFEYQYLKNVEDTSLIKYHITSAMRYRADETFDEGGMDIRGLTPYGIRREFTIANYDGYTTIDLTEIYQQFATYNQPGYDGFVNFNMTSSNIKELVNNIGLSNQEYESSSDSMDLLDKIAKQIIDNFEIKNNWPKIYKDSMDAIEVDLIKGPHYGKDLPISYLRSRIGFYGGTEINYDADATIINSSLLETGAEYSLSLALKSKTDLFIVATDYHRTENIEDDYIQSDISWGNLEGINISIDGEYELTIVLTKKVNGKDVVILDTLEPVFVVHYVGFDIADTIDSYGVTHTYKVKGTGGKLVVTVSSVETNI